jgi:hypothetical protein
MTEAKPYDSNLSLIKAMMCDERGTILKGFYCNDNGKHYLKIPDRPMVVPINPYTVCRNSGIKDKNGNFVFEYDLLKLTHGMKNPCFGFLVWDEFYKAWKIRRRTDRTAYSNIDNWTIEAIGNIVLLDADAEIIYKQEKEEDAKETFIDNSYCPSCFKR